MPRSRIPLPDGLGDAFAVDEAIALGATRSRLRRRDLERPFHGVRATAPATDVVARCRQYAARMPSESFFCGPTAAAIWRIPLPGDLEQAADLHVGVPNPRRAPRGAGVTGHKYALGEFDVVEHTGLRVTAPERTWVDLARQLRVSDVVAAGDALVHHRMPVTSIADLAAASASASHRPGHAVRVRALPLLSDRADSRPESLVRVALQLAGLGDVRPNLRVDLPGGARAWIDLAFPVERVGIEYQGAHHLDLAQRRRDLHRMQALREIGWTLIEAFAEDLPRLDLLVARTRRMLGR